MIRIALVGEIGSGKSFISNLFGFPVFDADKVVSKIYDEDKSVYKKLKKKLPTFFNSFPVKKNDLIKSISKNKKNIKIISNIVHPIVRKHLQKFLKKNKKRKVVILDIPLFLENKLDNKNDVIIFIKSKNSLINKKLKLRKNFNKSLVNKLRAIQLPTTKKKKMSHFTIVNDFKKNSARKSVKIVLNKIL